MTSFQDSLVALIFIRNSIERVILPFYDVTDGPHLKGRMNRLGDPSLVFSTQNHLQILISSFLEEGKRFQSFAKDDLAVRETLGIVKPAWDYVSHWKDIYYVRSALLAHSPRDKAGNLVSPSELFETYRSPTTIHETLLLGFCILMIVDNIKERHKEACKQADRETMSRMRAISNQGISSFEAVEKEFARIQSEIEAAKHKA